MNEDRTGKLNFMCSKNRGSWKRGISNEDI